MNNPIVLKIDGLTKSFGNLVAVNNLNLEVFSGEVFGLLGPNGAGKTTTINLISGLLKPDAGEVYLQGEKCTPGEVGIRKKIGICPQENVLWKRLTPYEQLKFLGSMYELKPSLIRQRSRAAGTVHRDFIIGEEKSSVPQGLQYPPHTLDV